ncbi:structural protein P5 [Viscerimonas tarda]
MRKQNNLSRGLRNNNPGNIRINKDRFQGEISPSQDAAFKQFTNIAYGYRAMFVSLDTYRKRGLDTIEKIISAWAPPVENNTQAYINAIVNYSGLPKDKVLTDCAGDDYIKIVAAMSQVENGLPAMMIDIEDGFRLQSKIRKQ